jgi:hypothetical protein
MWISWAKQTWKLVIQISQCTGAEARKDMHMSHTAILKINEWIQRTFQIGFTMSWSYCVCTKNGAHKKCALVNSSTTSIHARFHFCVQQAEKRDTCACERSEEQLFSRSWWYASSDLMKRASKDHPTAHAISWSPRPFRSSRPGRGPKRPTTLKQWCKIPWEGEAIVNQATSRKQASQEKETEMNEHGSVAWSYLPEYLPLRYMAMSYAVCDCSPEPYGLCFPLSPPNVVPDERTCCHHTHQPFPISKKKIHSSAEFFSQTGSCSLATGSDLIWSVAVVRTPQHCSQSVKHLSAKSRAAVLVGNDPFLKTVAKCYAGRRRIQVLSGSKCNRHKSTRLGVDFWL